MSLLNELIADLQDVTDFSAILKAGTQQLWHIRQDLHRIANALERLSPPQFPATTRFVVGTPVNENITEVPDMVQLTNGQMVPASQDVFDEKGKLIAVLPEGTTHSVVSSNDQIAQWKADGPGVNQGHVTTEHDEVGECTLTGTLVIPATATSEQKTLVKVLEVTVLNSPPSSSEFTVGVPISDAPPVEPPPPAEPTPTEPTEPPTP